MSKGLRQRLQQRFVWYSAVGISTFFLDLGILYLLLSTTPIAQGLAIALSFAVGVTTNFLLCYYWVYRGTERNQLVGYLLFAGLALIGVTFVTLSTEWLYAAFGLNLYIARTLVAACVGIINFTLNTFFNFRLV